MQSEFCLAAQQPFILKGNIFFEHILYHNNLGHHIFINSDSIAARDSVISSISFSSVRSPDWLSLLRLLLHHQALLFRHYFIFRIHMIIIDSSQVLTGGNAELLSSIDEPFSRTKLIQINNITQRHNTVTNLFRPVRSPRIASGDSQIPPIIISASFNSLGNRDLTLD